MAIPYLYYSLNQVSQDNFCLAKAIWT